LLLAWLLLSATPIRADRQCQFILGFQTLHDLDSADVGNCVDQQAFAANGDAQQHTTNGLLVWRKADNWTAFTNGSMTWINGPTGLVSRLNSQRFPWEADAGAASPIPASFFGMTTTRATAYPALSLGALGKPPNFGWPWNEPSPGVFNWNTVDADLDQADRHGVDFLYDLGGTPPWAAANPSSCRTRVANVGICTSPPARLQDWQDYVTAVATRYQGRIKFYELWNEPNARNFWSGSYADMVTLARSAYTIIKAIDPAAQVLTPAPTGPVGSVNGVVSASDWMAGYLQAGGASYADIGAWHGYMGRTGATPFPEPEQDASTACPTPQCYGSILTKVHTMRAVFDANGMAGKPMFDTEGSWGVTTNVPDPQAQSAWLARWYLLQASSYASDNLQRVYWYAWGQGGASNGWGTIDDAAEAPTDAGLAYNQVYTWLVGATMTGPCTADPNGLWTCPLSRSGGYQAVVVWSTAGPADYTAPPGSRQYRDLAGHTVAISGTITVGPAPLLIEPLARLDNGIRTSVSFSYEVTLMRTGPPSTGLIIP